MSPLFIFDYDGLLVNTEQLAFQAEAELLRSVGIQLTQTTFDECLGMPVRTVMETYRRQYHLKKSAEELMCSRNQAMERLMADRLELMPGARELIEFLRNLGWELAIASSGTKDYIMRGITKMGIRDSFDVLVSVDEVQKGKPSPDLVLEALKRAGNKPETAVMADDAPKGIAAANAAGVYSIAIPARGHAWTDFQNASAIFQDLNALLAFLQVAHGSGLPPVP
ncbi:MAG: HAD family phosphatase [Candidatus Peribacteraceae bacterium]|jgi:HAD superfamily hydrolase (TIGR01509 family)